MSAPAVIEPETTVSVEVFVDFDLEVPCQLRARTEPECSRPAAVRVCVTLAVCGHKTFPMLCCGEHLDLLVRCDAVACAGPRGCGRVGPVLSFKSERL